MINISFETSHLFHAESSNTRCHRLIDFAQFLRKQFPVFGPHDRLDLGAQHLHTEPLQDALFLQLHATIQGRLPAKREEDSVGSFGFYDLKMEKFFYLHNFVENLNTC